VPQGGWQGGTLPTVPGSGSHRLRGLRGLRSPATGSSASLGDEAAAQAQAEGRDQQDADVGCHETHRVGDVAQVQPGGGWIAGQGRARGCPPATASPQPHATALPSPGDPDVPGKDLPGAACGEEGRC